MATCAKAVANGAPRCQGAAFEALEVGLSVIPVGRDKRPLVRWQAFQQRRATEEEAEEWFARWPDAQIGLVTGGLSGVDVVDFDTRDAPWPPRGRELPTDVVVATGGGGLHYYVRHTAGVRNSAGRLADGVDVRGEGGYVVLPPSESHKGAYRFELGSIADIATVAAGPPPEPWLAADLLRACGQMADPSRRLPRLREGTQDPAVPGAGGCDAAYPPGGEGTSGRANEPGQAADAARTAWLDPASPEPIPKGRRNTTLFHIAGRLWRHGMDEDEVRETLLATNAERCQPPLDDAEVVQIAANAVRYVRRPRKLEAPITSFPCTESGNAELMVHLYGAELRHDHTRGQWLRWAGHWWRPDRTGEVSQLAKEAARVRANEAADLRRWEDVTRKDHGESDAHAAWARRSEADAAIQATLRRLATERGIATTHDDWDRHARLLATANGVLDLDAGALVPPRPDQLIRLRLGAAFEPEAACPRWMQFLDEIFGCHAGLAAFIQRAAGYSMAGEPAEQVWLLLHGRGANGKSVFLRVLGEVFGDYAVTLPFSCFESRRGDSIPNDLAMLPGARLAVAGEPSDGARFDAARLKALTGGDVVTARFLRREYFSFRPRCVPWLAANRLPRVSDDSDGFWRRCLVVPFSRQFLGGDAELGLTEQLLAERSGILNWLLAGHRAWRDGGLGVPRVVREAVSEYRVSSDSVARFVAEGCETGPDHQATAAALYDAYRKWALADGVPESRLLARNSFGRRLGQRFDKGRVGAKARRIYRGIAPLSH